MKTKIKVVLMCCILLCMSLFTGCTLVETNNSKLYNDIVAEIYNNSGEKVAEITNRELLSGYESYGSIYVQNYNYSKEEAVNMTLVQLENRKITLLTAEELYNLNFSTGDGLEPKEISYIYDATVASLESNLKTYYDEIVNQTSTENNSDDEIKFDGYTKNVELGYESVLVGGKTEERLVLKPITKQDGLLDRYRPTTGVLKSYYVSNDKKEIYDNFIDKALSSKDYETSFKYYLSDLKAAEYGMNLSKDTKSIFEREIERLYKINYENYVIQKYSYDNRKSSDISPVTTDEILKLYSSKVRAGYTKYVIENDGKYNDNISESLSDIYYFKNDEGVNKYFTVANILFQFSDEQKSKYEEINSKLNSSEPYDSYEEDMNILYNSIIPLIRQYNEDTGVYDEIDNEFNLSVNDIIYNKIQIALLNAQATGNNGIIGDTINNFIYTYNQDPGMFNAESNNVIGVDSEGKAVSSFVEEFNEAGLKLYNNGQGKVGDMEIAKSSYGIHVLVYTGECTNLFDGIDENFELSGNSQNQDGEDALIILANTRINKLVDKTYLDLLYDEIYQDNFSYFEQANINFLRENYDIKTYKGRLPSTLK